MSYVMGLDPSLASTGLIVLDSSGALTARERITSLPSGPMVAARLRHRVRRGVRRVAEKGL